MPSPPTKIDPERHGPAGLRTFLNIAKLWNLSEKEQMLLLGIQEMAMFNDWKVRVRANGVVAIPMEVIERIGCILSIYGSLVTLLSEERAGYWLRTPNTHPLFEGRSALATITTGDFNDLRKVAGYLLSQIYGSW